MKKNVFRTVFVLLFVVSMGFYACSEDATNTETDQTVTPKATFVNPLEYVGIEHNEFMQVFTQKLEESFHNGQWDRVAFLSNDFKYTFSSVMNDAYHMRYTQTNSTVAYQMSIYDQVNINEWFDGDNNTSLDLAANVLNSNATPRDRDFTMNLLHDLFVAGNSPDAFNAVGAVINHHEQLILSETWTPNEDYALGAIAVAKYSKIFWESYNFSVFSYGAEDVDPRNATIVGADAAGYVIGGVTGGTAGSFAGPAGTVGGVLGGKAAGAWVGSAAAATAFVIYDAFVDFFS
jgi:hypothetical protein